MPPPAALCTGRIRLSAHMLLACAGTCRALHPRHGTPAHANSNALPARIPDDSSEEGGLGEALGAPPGLLLDAEESMVVRCDIGLMLWMLGLLLAGRLRPAAFRFISTCACTPVMARQRQREGERAGREKERKGEKRRDKEGERLRGEIIMERNRGRKRAHTRVREKDRDRQQDKRNIRATPFPRSLPLSPPGPLSRPLRDHFHVKHEQFATLLHRNQ